MLNAIPKGHRIVTLEVTGQPWDTPKLAKQLESWQLDGRDVALLVGGPEGLSPDCIKASEQKWSLSALNITPPYGKSSNCRKSISCLECKYQSSLS